MSMGHISTLSSGPIPHGESAAALLLEHARARRTGMLELYANGRVHGLALRRGVPLHCSPGTPPWRLGDVIIHQGMPRAGDVLALKRALIATSDGSRSGERLARLGLVSRADVDLALKVQLRLRAREPLSCRAGRYRFFTGPGALRNVPRLPDLWTAEALVAATRESSCAHEELLALLRHLERSEDPFEAFDLPRGASIEQVRAAFRRLAKAHHPDHLQEVTDPTALELHKHIFEAALEAYERSQ